MFLACDEDASLCRPRTPRRDYIPKTAWEYVRISQEELENNVEETDVD